jgi:hypothetical protein
MSCIATVISALLQRSSSEASTLKVHSPTHLACSVCPCLHRLTSAIRPNTPSRISDSSVAFHQEFAPSMCIACPRMQCSSSPSSTSTCSPARRHAPSIRLGSFYDDAHQHHYDAFPREPAHSMCLARRPFTCSVCVRYHSSSPAARHFRRYTPSMRLGSFAMYIAFGAWCLHRIILLQPRQFYHDTCAYQATLVYS